MRDYIHNNITSRVITWYSILNRINIPNKKSRLDNHNYDVYCQDHDRDHNPENLQQIHRSLFIKKLLIKG